MLARTIILSLIFLTIQSAGAQSLIGLTKDEVATHIKKEYKNFSEDNSVVKKAFNYLKYVNDDQTITMLVFFSENDISTSVKKVCDYAEYDFVLDNLNQNCTKTNVYAWDCIYDDENIVVTMEEKDWYFVIREKRKEE